MAYEKKQCEVCAWPLECSGDMKAQKPEGADCPREANVWDRRLGDTKIALADDADLAELVETERRQAELVLA